MKVEYRQTNKKDPRDIMLELLEKNRQSLLIFSRLKGEVVAIVPSPNTEENFRTWVWLSTDVDTSYTDGKVRNEKAVARTLVFGGWNHQPNACIQLEDIL